MADLSTLASCKEHLGISATTFDAVIGTLLSRASDWIEAYCDRTFASTAYTEDYDGDGSDTLIVRNPPIVSVTSLHDDQARDFTSATLIDADDYYVDTAKGMVKLISGRFSFGRGNVRAAYTGGFATVPKAVALAAVELTAFWFNRRKSSGRASESLGGLSVSHLTEVPGDIKEILDQYVVRVATR